MPEKLKEKIVQCSYMEMAALIISVVSIALFTLFTNYSDTNALLRTHFFWDSLFDGSIIHFFDNFTSSNMHNCNLLSRLLLIIWYLPSWILTKLLGGAAYTVL